MEGGREAISEYVARLPRSVLLLGNCENGRNDLQLRACQEVTTEEVLIASLSSHRIK